MKGNTKSKGTYIPPALGYRPDIDGLRALAVVLVVAYHARVPFVSGGFVGVDVFFVISGFLITSLLLAEARDNGQISFVNFIARRFRRLLPMASIVLVATGGAALILVAPLDFGTFSSQIAASALWVANWYFVSESANYFAADISSAPTLHYWSLSVEEQFYLLWPATVAVAAGLGFRRRGTGGIINRGRLAMVVGLIIAASLLVSILTRWTGGVWSYYGLHTRAWELGTGALLAIVAADLPALKAGPSRLLRWAGVFLIAYAAFAFDERTAFPGAAAIIPVAGTAMVIAAGFSSAGRSWLEHPLMVATGKRSYSWYLWHWPVLIFLPMAVERATGDGHHVAVVALAVLVSLIAADLSFRYIEDPIRRARGLKASLGRTYLFGFASLAAVLLVAQSVAGPTVWEGPAAAIGELSANGADTPEKARADRGGLNDNFNCTLGYRHVEIDMRCRFGAPNGDMSVALVGDSHAAHWAPALHQLARERGWKLWVSTKSACPITDVSIYETDLKGRYQACEVWRKNLKQNLASIPDLGLLVIGRSQAYTAYVLDGNGAYGEAVDAGALWEHAMVRTLEEWDDVVPAVAIIRDTPKAPEDVPSCLSVRNRGARACSFSSEGAFTSDEVLAGAEIRAVKTYAARTNDTVPVAIFSPGKSICQEESCKVVSDDGVIRYRDRHHLTATFAQQLWNEFDAVLTPLVDAGGGWENGTDRDSGLLTGSGRPSRSLK